MFLLHSHEGHAAYELPETALYKADLNSPCFVCWVLLLKRLSMRNNMVSAENGRLNSTTSELMYSGFSRNVISSAPCRMLHTSAGRPDFSMQSI